MMWKAERSVDWLEREMRRRSWVGRSASTPRMSRRSCGVRHVAALSKCSICFLSLRMTLSCFSLPVPTIQYGVISGLSP